MLSGKESVSHMYAVEWAHAVPACPLPPGNPPCQFLFKLLNFKDRDTILSKARTRGFTLVMDNSQISLFSDFSSELQKQCVKFTDIEKNCHAAFCLIEGCGTGRGPLLWLPYISNTMACQGGKITQSSRSTMSSGHLNEERVNWPGVAKVSASVSFVKVDHGKSLLYLSLSIKLHFLLR